MCWSRPRRGAGTATGPRSTWSARTWSGRSSWIDKDGDLDGDGLQEYRTRAPHGYYNQGWKDAGDAIVHPDGRLASLPIALCEIQGLVVAAKRAWADVLDQVYGDVLRRRPAARAGTAAGRGDRDQVLVGEPRAPTTWGSTGTSSRSGRSRPTPGSSCGLARSTARASRYSVAGPAAGTPTCGAAGESARCRTAHVAYNPFSYQLGSVWPHDNALIAAGFRHYGLDARGRQVARGTVRRGRAVLVPAAARAVRRAAARRGRVPGAVPGRQRAAGVGVGSGHSAAGDPARA